MKINVITCSKNFPRGNFSDIVFMLTTILHGYYLHCVHSVTTETILAWFGSYDL